MICGDSAVLSGSLNLNFLGQAGHQFGPQGRLHWCHRWQLRAPLDSLHDLLPLDLLRFALWLPVSQSWLASGLSLCRICRICLKSSMSDAFSSVSRRNRLNKSFISGLGMKHYLTSPQSAWLIFWCLKSIWECVWNIWDISRCILHLSYNITRCPDFGFFLGLVALRLCVPSPKPWRQVAHAKWPKVDPFDPHNINKGHAALGTLQNLGRTEKSRPEFNISNKMWPVNYSSL